MPILKMPIRQVLAVIASFQLFIRTEVSNVPAPDTLSLGAIPESATVGEIFPEMCNKWRAYTGPFYSGTNASE